MTEGSWRLVLINHCSVFDLSFAKGAKGGGGGWPEQGRERQKERDRKIKKGMTIVQMP